MDMSRNFQHPGRFYRHPRQRKGDKVLFGFIVMLVGLILMLKKLNLFYFDWHSFWPIIFIVIGFFVGVQKRFKNNLWWILMLIGVIHLIPEFTILGTSSASLMLPAALIIGGLVLVFRGGKTKECNMESMQVVTNNESTLNIDVTFGGRKEIVTSKEFRGGTISSTFGGVEVNMVQADSSVQPMVLDLKVMFGAAELIVPSHWELQNEIEPTMGSVEDHRSMRTSTVISEEKKILILRGTCNFGSIEIKSY